MFEFSPDIGPAMSCDISWDSSTVLSLGSCLTSSYSSWMLPPDADCLGLSLPENHTVSAKFQLKVRKKKNDLHTPVVRHCLKLFCFFF